MLKIKINQNNADLLHRFIQNLGEASNSFRYFNKRGIEALNNHLLTVLYIENESPVAYGHLDKSDNEVWLGIAVIPEFQGKGISHQIMDVLITAAIDLQLESISLTVDNVNKKAIELYLKKGFIEEKKLETFTKFRLNFK